MFCYTDRAPKMFTIMLTNIGLMNRSVLLNWFVWETLDRIVSQYKQSDVFILIAKLTMNCENSKMHAHDLVTKIL